jgi:hypothetical protein
LAEEEDRMMPDDCRDGKTGQFLQGFKGGGRPPGARPKLSALFWNDLHAVWKEQGRVVMERLAQEDPATFAKIAAMCVLKPSDDQAAANTVTVVNVITGVRG